MQTLTITQALSEGYTHFMMGSSHEEEFEVYPLTKDVLQVMITNAADEGEGYDENIFGKKPYLCNKEILFPSVSIKTMAELIADKIELSDELAPCAIAGIQEDLPKEKEFQKAVESINALLREYKSYTDTDILVTLD